jgi:hypothetical protein
MVGARGRTAATLYTLNKATSKNKHETITINVPVVYMGRYEVVLRGDYP